MSIIKNPKVTLGYTAGRAKDFVTGTVIPAGQRVVWLQFTSSSRYPIGRATLQALARELEALACLEARVEVSMANDTGSRKGSAKRVTSAVADP